MRVLLLTSYCSEKTDNCTDGLPCEECLKMCNIADIPDKTKIRVIAGWDYLEDCRHLGESL